LLYTPGRAIARAAWIAVAIATLFGGVAPAAPAHEQTEDEQHAAAVALDTQAWADAEGISFDEADSRQKARAAVNDAVVAIFNDSANYAGVYFTETATDFTMHVVAKGWTVTLGGAASA
jgi:hypothetical protein